MAQRIAEERAKREEEAQRLAEEKKRKEEEERQLEEERLQREKEEEAERLQRQVKHTHTYTHAVYTPTHMCAHTYTCIHTGAYTRSIHTRSIHTRSIRTRIYTHTRVHICARRLAHTFIIKNDHTGECIIHTYCTHTHIQL